MEEVNLVISDSSILDVPDDEFNSNVGKISEAPTTSPGIHDQNVVPSDAYFNMEFQLPRVSDNALICAVV